MRTSRPFLSILIAVAVTGASRVSGAEPDSLVGDLRVEGNRRTAAPVILDAAGVKRGDPFSPGILTEVKQRVLNLRLFREVTVVPEPRGSEVDLSIHVVERWTLLPVPFVGVSSRGVRAGAFVLESNLLGRNKLLVVGGTYSGEGPTAFALYRDPGVAGSRALLRASLRHADQLREQFDGDDRIYAYRDSRVEATLSGGHQVLPWLATYLGWYGLLSSAEPEADDMPPPEAGPLHGWTADIEVRAQDFHLYFNEGLMARLTYRHALAALGAARDVLELGRLAQYAWRLAADQSTSVTVQGALSDGDPVLDAILLGGLPGTRGFERLALWGERAASVVLEHQVPVLRFRWGIWTVNGFAEAGRVEWRDRRWDYITPGLGFRLYLLGVAFPALGVDVAWSIEDRRPLATASFGFMQ